MKYLVTPLKLKKDPYPSLLDTNIWAELEPSRPPPPGRRCYWMADDNSLTNCCRADDFWHDSLQTFAGCRRVAMSQWKACRVIGSLIVRRLLTSDCRQVIVKRWPSLMDLQCLQPNVTWGFPCISQDVSIIYNNYFVLRPFPNPKNCFPAVTEEYTVNKPNGTELFNSYRLNSQMQKWMETLVDLGKT